MLLAGVLRRRVLQLERRSTPGAFGSVPLREEAATVARDHRLKGVVEVDHVRAEVE